MKYQNKPPLERTLDRAKQRRARIGVMALLSAIVAVITFNRLTFRADTLERVAACGLAEHAHTEACCDETGALICGLEEHIHTDACYQARPVEVSTDDFLEIELECEDIEEPALELDELSLGESDAEIIAETPIPEFAPEAEAPDHPFIIGEQCPVYLGAILDAVGLSVDDPVEVGQVVDEDHPEGMIWFEQDAHGLAIYPARSFEQVELAVFTEDDIIIVNLLNAVVPEAAPTPQTTEESSNIEDAVEPEETPKSDVTTEPEETSAYYAAIEAEETPAPETIIEPENTLEPEASAEPEETTEPELLEADIEEEQPLLEPLSGTFAVDVDGADYALYITVPEAANLPGTATFKAIAVEDGVYESTALDYFPNDSERSLLALFDLTILVDEQAVQPEAALEVCVDFQAALPGNIQVAAVHFPEHELEDAIPTRKRLMTSAVNPETEVIEARVDETGVSFRASNFSVYAVVSKTLETVLRASDQRNYWIEVAYDEAANIPDGAQLSVSEVPEEGEEYAEGIDRMTRALSDAYDLVFVSDARLFNIDILYGGERIEPDAPVLVTVRYADPVPLEDDVVFEVVHLPEGDAEVLPIEKMESDTFSFETGSFSTFAFGQANYIGSLNGQSFAIVRDNGSNKVALLFEAENGTMLKGTYVNVLEEGVLTAVTAANGKVESDMPITVWTFEHVRDNLYYIRSDGGQYMNLTTGSLTVGDAPGLIEVYPIDASGNLSGYIRLRCADDTAYVISNRWGSAAGGFQAAKSTDGNTRFALYASVDNAVYPEFTAQKHNASELEGGKSYVIHQRVYDEELGE